MSAFRPRPRPLWYYGFLCLIASSLPAVLTTPPRDPQEQENRFHAQVLFSTIGFGLVGAGLWKAYRDRR